VTGRDRVTVFVPVMSSVVLAVTILRTVTPGAADPAAMICALVTASINWSNCPSNVVAVNVTGAAIMIRLCVSVDIFIIFSNLAKSNF
jgi:hypothetical protein